jgi:translation initiation factor IF-2
MAPVRNEAQAKGIEIRLYSIIYKVLEDIEAALKGLLDPVYEEVVTGQAEVRQTFKLSTVGTIAGCYVTDGVIERNSLVRILRDGIVIFEGKMASLKRFKDDVKEVKNGFECGITIEKFNDIKEGDVIEASVMKEVER